jgi:hypothetical protein
VDREKRRIGLSIRRAEEPSAAAAPAGPQLTPAQQARKQKKRDQLRGGLDF